MPLILGTNSIKDTGYNVANSCRFNDGDSAYLKFTSSSGNRRTWTFSTWVKRSTLTDDKQSLIGSYGAQSDAGYTQFRFQDGEVLNLTGWNTDWFTTNRKFRDVSAWLHIVLAVDTTNATAGNRLRLYINGTEETSFSQSNNPDENEDLAINVNGEVTYVGAESYTSGGSRYFDGYMAETVLIDGLQLAPTSFGEFDEDSPTIWKPIDVSGLTRGTNGFYLDFEDSSNLGKEAFGDTDLTEVNLAATDQSTDTCTNNFCTLNPLDNSTAVSFDLSQGNLVLGDIGSGDNDHGLRGTFGVNAGKWYYEVKRLETSGTFGVIGSDVKLEFDLENNTSGPAHIMSSNGTGSSLVYWNDGSFTNNASLQGYAANDIIGVALDMDNGKLFFSINGVFKGFDNNASDPAAGTNANFTDIPTDGTFMMPYVSKRGTANPSDQYNFGGTQSFTISSGNTDGNGFGNFEYAPPSGFLALCTKNLAESG